MNSYIIYAIMGAIFAALSTIIAKVGLSKIDAVEGTVIRSIIMSIILILISIYLNKFNLTKIIEKYHIYIILSGIFGALSWLFFFNALQKGDTITVSLLDKSSIIFIIIFSILFLGEKLTISKAIGSILIVLGIYLLIF